MRVIMKNKLKFVLIAICSALMFTSLIACEEDLRKTYRDQGYTVSVTYDANGGIYLGRPGITVVDMINPTTYAKGADGKYHIKLDEPTSSERPSGGSDGINLTKTSNNISCFFAGWYQERIPVTDNNGNVLDDDGRVLTEENGTYYYTTASGEKMSSSPAYTYDKRWDFENDTIDYADGDGNVNITLYAGWVKFYEFDYYYLDGDNGWKMVGSTYFDYKTTNAEGSASADYDTIWVPRWNDGAMTYTHRYENSGLYTFPKVDGTTFDKAYLDEDMTEEITDGFTHQGTLDLEHGVANNRVQNIYFVAEQGEFFKISTAKQLADYATAEGIYEIAADLDFEGETWPNAFGKGEFKGKIYGKDGQTFKFKNVKYNCNSSGENDIYGGLFGHVASGAEIKGISFENATVDLIATSVRLRNVDTYFGIFAGLISSGATVENVSVDGTLRINGYGVYLSDGASINLVANFEGDGNLEIFEIGSLKLEAYGQDTITYYSFRFDPETVTVDENYNVDIKFSSLVQCENEVYVVYEKDN